MFVCSSSCQESREFIGELIEYSSSDYSTISTPLGYSPSDCSPTVSPQYQERVMQYSQARCDDARGRKRYRKSRVTWRGALGNKSSIKPRIVEEIRANVSSYIAMRKDCKSNCKNICLCKAEIGQNRDREWRRTDHQFYKSNHEVDIKYFHEYIDKK